MQAGGAALLAFDTTEDLAFTDIAHVAVKTKFIWGTLAFKDLILYLNGVRGPRLHRSDAQAQDGRLIFELGGAVAAG